MSQQQVFCEIPADMIHPNLKDYGTEVEKWTALTIEEQYRLLKCPICGAEAYPTPTGRQCAAYSNHKHKETQSSPKA